MQRIAQPSNLLLFPDATRISPIRRLAQDALQRHEQHKALRRVTMDMRAAAATQGHRLGAFLQSPPDDLLLASCLLCGAGVTVTPEAALASVSPLLAGPCPRSAGRE